jgi:hypothetical protein
MDLPVERLIVAIVAGIAAAIVTDRLPWPGTRR